MIVVTQPVLGETAVATGRPVEVVLAEQALDWLQVNVLKLLATRVIPLVIASGVVTGGLAWLEEKIGVNLPPATLATICFTMLAGVVATATAYVKNHSGAAKLGAALLELKKVQSAGVKATEGWDALPSGPRS